MYDRRVQGPIYTVVTSSHDIVRDDVATVHYNQIKPDWKTVSSDASFADPPLATRFYEVPSEGGAAHPCPRPGTEDSVSLREWMM